MPKPYAFSPDEFFSVHPSRIDALRGELSSCLEVFDFVMDHAGVQNVPGLCGVLEMLRANFEGAVNRVDSEALRAMHTALEQEVNHAQQ